MISGQSLDLLHYREVLYFYLGLLRVLQSLMPSVLSSTTYILEYASDIEMLSILKDGSH